MKKSGFSCVRRPPENDASYSAGHTAMLVIYFRSRCGGKFTRFYEVRFKSLLSCYPKSCEAVHWGHHRLLAKRFPYAVYYRVTGKLIRVHAVLDCRRNPAWIRDRLI